MKKIALFTLAAIFITMPMKTYAAFAVGWNATSTATPLITPNLVNGVYQSIMAPTFIATSTTATSTFANGLSLTAGCFFSNGACISSSGSNLWIANGNDIYNSNSGQVSVGSSSPPANAVFSVNQTPGKTGPGTVSNSASGTTVTGVGTFFTQYFQRGDSITINGETHFITAIGSDTSLTTLAWTGANSGAAYTIPGGNTLFQVNPNGYIQLGSSGTAFNGIMGLVRTFTDGVTGTTFGLNMNPVLSRTVQSGAGTFDGLLSIPTVAASNTQNMTGNVVGVQLSPTILSGATGAISTITGVLVGGNGSGNNSTGATLTSYIGERIQNPTATGAVTNSIGLQIDPQSVATNMTALLMGQTAAPTGSYGIYNSSANNNYFAGNTGIGTSSPSGLLTVSGSNNSTSLTSYQSSPNISIINRSQTVNSITPLDFRMTNSSGTELSGAMIAGVNTDPTAASEDMDITFSDIFAGTFNEKMRLKGVNFGIGTTSPYAALSVVGSTGVVAGKYQATSTGSDFIARGTDGTCTGAPYAFAENLNTGAYLPNPNQYGVCANGTEVFRALIGAIPGGSTNGGKLANPTNDAYLGLDGDGTISLTSKTAKHVILNPGTGGNVGISTTSPTSRLSVNGSSYFAGSIYATSTVTFTTLTAFSIGDSAVCQRSTGEITVDTGVSSCIVSSRKVKHDISDDSLEAAQARVAKLDPVTFSYNATNKKDIGLIAEDVAQIDPRYAQYNSKGEPSAINWSAITADLIKVVQSQKTSSSKDSILIWYALLLVAFINFAVIIIIKKK